MQGRRRLIAPLAGVLLALSLAIGPVSAQSVQTSRFSVCTVLLAIENQLPNVPGLQAAFAAALAQLGCEDGTPL
jgi:hypothetical protein